MSALVERNGSITSDLHITSRYFERYSNDPNEESYFRLNDLFLQPYRREKPKFGFNGLGEFVFYRTYSRVKADGAKETFLDTVRRVVEGCYEIQRRHCRKLHIPWDYDKALDSAQEMFDRIWDFKFTPPGRGFWMMGTPFMWERGSAALNNCGFVSTADIDVDPAEPFHFMMDMSMLGVGVGFDTRGAGKLRINCPGPGIKTTYQIPDSREGWCHALRLLIQSYTTHLHLGTLTFDFSRIRPAGSDINGFGGKASGPGILVELLQLIQTHLERRIGLYLDSVDITDLMNYIGRCVVAGNVRRCLPAGTLVHLKRGLVPIEQVQVGDLVLTADGYHPVAENVRQGVQRVITVQTQTGPFRCTAKHLMAVMTSFGEYDWKRAYQLKQGDRLVFVDEVIPGVATVLPGYHESCKRGKAIVIPGLTPDVAWFLGAIHGDGYVYPGRRYRNRKHHGASVMVPVNRDEYHDGITDKIDLGFAAFGFLSPGEQPSQDNCRKVRVTSRHLANYLHQHFKQARTPLGVPECVRLGVPDIRAGYLAGLLDTDGSVKNRPTTLVVSVYRDFLRQVQAVYASLGIPVRLRLRKEADETCQAKWELDLVGDYAIAKFRETVQPYAVKQLREFQNHSSHDFGYPAEWVAENDLAFGRAWSPQQEQMTQSCAVRCGAVVRNLIPVEVISVVDEGIECETHDISVPDRCEFVAQGLLVHNTAQIAFGNHDDLAYITMKNKQIYPSECESHRWASNNSVFAEVGISYDQIAEQINVCGEPGLLWLSAMRDYGRMIDGPQPGIDGKVMGGNPCLEQSLESYELCNLVEAFPANHDNADDFLRTIKFAYLYAKTVTLLPTHNARTNQITLRNRRIGLSQSGIVQAFAKFGRRAVLRDFCDAGYNEVRRWDKIYADWLCVQLSIKLTSVKPSGTVSLLAGATPGIHYPEASTYWRRVRLASDSILVDIFRDAGYHIEPAKADPVRTTVVKFAVTDERVRPTKKVSIWEQVANAVDYQRYWADNQVSCTIKVQDHERDQVAKVLEVFEDQLKGISFLPEDHGYEQAPYEPCTPEEVTAYNATLKPLDFSRYIYDGVGSKFCDSDKCEIDASHHS